MPTKFTSTKLMLLIPLIISSLAAAEDNYSLDGGDTTHQNPNSTNTNDESTTTDQLIAPEIQTVEPNASNPTGAPGESPEQSLATPNEAKSNPNVQEQYPTPPQRNVLSGDGSTAPIRNSMSLDKNDFGGVAAIPGTRRNLAPGEAPEIYMVEDGDTMFDVCSQLIDDGNYWPKLWALNPDVRNPHFIYPGMRLAFYSGDSDSPPYMEVVSEDEMIPVEKSGISEAELVAESSVSIPAGAEGASVKVLQSIEDPSPVAIVSPGDIDAESESQDGVIYTGRYSPADDLSFIMPAFYFAEDVPSLGEVVSGLSGQRLLGGEKKVYIKSENDLKPGAYTILRRTGNVSSLVHDDDIGVRYEFAGHVRLTRKSNTGLIEALVFESRTGIQPEDIVVNYISTHRRVNQISASGPAATARSSVIGFTESGQHAGGKGDLVFLEKEGLSVGGFYSIFSGHRYRDVRHLRDDASIEALPLIGIIRVIEISGESAVGIIVAGNSEVRVGDTLFAR